MSGPELQDRVDTLSSFHAPPIFLQTSIPVLLAYADGVFELGSDGCVSRLSKDIGQRPLDEAGIPPTPSQVDITVSVYCCMTTLSSGRYE